MKYKLIPFAGIAGKTVRKVFQLSDDYSTCFSFTDGTFCIVWGYDDGSINCIVANGTEKHYVGYIEESIDKIKELDNI